MFIWYVFNEIHATHTHTHATAMKGRKPLHTYCVYDAKQEEVNDFLFGPHGCLFQTQYVFAHCALETHNEIVHIGIGQGSVCYLVRTRVSDINTDKYLSGE